MKAQDPTSVVRENEFNAAANSSGLIEGLGNRWTRTTNGRWLNDQQRREMLRTAWTSYLARRQTYNEMADQYRGYARDYGVNPDRVARTYTTDKPAVSPSGRMSQFRVIR